MSRTEFRRKMAELGLRPLSKKRHAPEKTEVKKSGIRVLMGMKGRAKDLEDPAPDPDEDQTGRLENLETREVSWTDPSFEPADRMIERKALQQVDQSQS